jgi:hypothetical protein
MNQVQPVEKMLVWRGCRVAGGMVRTWYSFNRTLSNSGEPLDELTFLQSPEAFVRIFGADFEVTGLILCAA